MSSLDRSAALDRAERTSAGTMHSTAWSTTRLLKASSRWSTLAPMKVKMGMTFWITCSGRNAASCETSSSA